jgi:uncharacterized repeat protein (TIGR01451 family)
VQDAGEAGIAGVVLNLHRAGTDGACDTADDVFVASDTTDSGGMYLFDPLPMGIYCVLVDESTLPADVFLSPGIDEPHGPIDLGPGEDYLGADFGYYPGGSIGDFVWLDEDRDGEQDSEPGIPGVVVNLHGAGADGLCSTADDVMLSSDTTDSLGKYLFDPLPIGIYCVDVDESTLPVGLNLSIGIQEPHGPIDLGPWEDYLIADFGFAYPDLDITKSVDTEDVDWPDCVHRYEDLTYTVIVVNNGPGPADGVVVTDEISEYLEYIRLNTSKGTVVWNSGTRTVTANIGHLDEGESATITIIAQAMFIPTAELVEESLYIYDFAEVDFIGEPGPERSNEVETYLAYFCVGEIPEPSTVILMGSGLMGLAGYARLRLRRRRRE